MRVEALRTGNAAPFLDETDLPYEEWLAVFAAGLSRFPDTTAHVLKELAREHFDDAVRFNAVQLLDDADRLWSADIAILLAGENDSDTRELLHEMQGN